MQSDIFKVGDEQKGGRPGPSLPCCSLISRSFNGVSEGLSRDDVLDNITLFWLTNTGGSAARLYWERMAATQYFN
jgi:hypothetical protein